MMFKIFKKRTPLQAELLKLRNEFPGEYCSVEVSSTMYGGGHIKTEWDTYVDGLNHHNGITFEEALKSIVAERDIIAERDSAAERDNKKKQYSIETYGPEKKNGFFVGGASIKSKES